VNAHFLDDVPVELILPIGFILGLLVYELGFRAGRWYQSRTPDEKEGPTGLLVGSLLAMLGFLLAISVGMAEGRFDARRGLVLQEANAIGTTFLRAGYLQEPQRTEIRNFLREYTPLRVNVLDEETFQAHLVRSGELIVELWARAEVIARENPESDMDALFIESLNEMIDLQESRTVVAIYARVPDTVLMILVLGSWFTLAMVGFNSGLSRKRSAVAAGILVLVMASVVGLIIDLDRPRDGFITVSQRALTDQIEFMGPPEVPPGS